MKLLRVGPRGVEKPAILDADGQIRDLSPVVADITGAVLDRRSIQMLAELDLAALPLLAPNLRIGPCVGQVGKFICVGLNYKDGVAELGMKRPNEPVLFMKATSAINGPNDPIIIPPGAEKMDWEVELGVVIGEEARYVRPDDAMSYVAGYCVVNDLCDRAFQTERGGQYTKGKSADTFGPIGPWLVSADEIDDPQQLDLWLYVDSEMRQRGNSRAMIFSVAKLVSYVSNFMSLQPGDIISTGTPAGVAMGMKPTAMFLRPGQTLRLGIQGLGEQHQVTEAFEPRRIANTKALQASRR